jgi:flavodoxin
MSKVLTLYYSRIGENYFSGNIKSIEKGNTAIVAEFVNAAVGGDLFELDTVEPYPADYHACVEVVQAEVESNARPAVVNTPDLNAYDVIFLGYPNWCGTAPMCLFTVLEKFDLSGKTIAPFCTNEGSGLGSSVADIKRVAPGANIVGGLSVFGGRAADSQTEASAWAESVLAHL